MIDLCSDFKKYLGPEIRYDFAGKCSVEGRYVTDQVKVCLGVSSFVHCIPFDARTINSTEQPNTLKTYASLLRLINEIACQKSRFTVTCAVQPVRKATPLVKILPNMNGLRTDEDVDYFLFKNRKDTAVINYGSSWCTHCHEMFPHLISLSKLFQGFKYAVGQVDYMNRAADGVEYTPTFIVYKKGKKVDQFYGANAQQLYDHLWLHN